MTVKAADPPEIGSAPSEEQAFGAASRSGPLERAVQVLELVAALSGRATLTDIGAILGLPKATTHRILGSLLEAGLIEGGGRNRPFLLGDRMTRLLHASARGDWVSTLVRPHLAALAETTGEACYLTRLAGHRVHVAVSVAPEVQWRSYVQPELDMPPHAAATAKAILAYQPEEVIARALADDLPALTSFTCTDPALVRDGYRTTRDQGYATCIAEIDEGLGALAVPVPQRDGTVLHSLGLTGPVQRIMNEGLHERVAILKAAAMPLSDVLSLGALITARTAGSV